MGTATGMEHPNSYESWIDRDVIDVDGDKIGTITDIFYDDVTGRPEWMKIKTGLFGGSRFAPIAGARLVEEGDDLRMQVSFGKDTVKNAPDVDMDNEGNEVSDREHLSAAEEQMLYAHYGYTYNNATAKGTYGSQYGKLRPDADYAYTRWNREASSWGEPRKHAEHTEEVPVRTTAQVEVPVEANVRLRRYQTQRTRNVPVTETEEHVEVADVDAKGKTQA